MFLCRHNAKYLKTNMQVGVGGGVGEGGCYTQTLKKKQEEEQMLLKMTHIQRIYYLIYCITQSQTYNYLIQSDIHSPYIVDL